MAVLLLLLLLPLHPPPPPPPYHAAHHIIVHHTTPRSTPHYTTPGPHRLSYGGPARRYVLWTWPTSPLIWRAQPDATPSVDLARFSKIFKIRENSEFWRQKLRIDKMENSRFRIRIFCRMPKNISKHSKSRKMTFLKRKVMNLQEGDFKVSDQEISQNA